MNDHLVDRREAWSVVSRRVKATGRVQNYVEDVVTRPDGGTMTRQWVTHTGAVAVIAMDDRGRIAVVHQYRHPVAYRLVEPPAGILDVDDEPAIEAARRELAEEAQLAADRWETLVDVFTSPGGMQESIRIFLARDLHPVPRPDGFAIADEEIDMGLYWMDLDEIVEKIYAGQIQSPTLIDGVLALKLAMVSGRLDSLRPADAPWDARRAKQDRDTEV
ncbi:hypothetical protein HMPREF1531_02570 [Propionibacterium sp. oral taxon 192 str. F0372]|uniref:NUDIX domain-containing protein n=1 Tax=Propionibacterium sp. oral taxon 192 TaxID=671222 RepID=UPI0003545CED|nr:NUDIX hydrolase [Propionibacterium sp. oral taxon 192]EPH00458.1 hypothetical protein HMPREF1531_02570 [Propionibacterium sp. oral taxon 192 str. F0372]